MKISFLQPYTNNKKKKIMNTQKVDNFRVNQIIVVLWKHICKTFMLSNDFVIVICDILTCT